LKARIAELEKTRALYGKHPQPGRSIEPQVLAFAAPQVVTLPLPEGAHWLKVDTRLDMQNPEVDEATMQWTMTTETPRDVTKIIPGVLTIWKRSTKKSGETMNDFNKMKTAFPDMFERRLEEVAQPLPRRPPAIPCTASATSSSASSSARAIASARRDEEGLALGGHAEPQQAWTAPRNTTAR
jgi:hypothetical protein